MATKKAATKKSNVIGIKSPIWVILLCAVVGYCFFQFVCGAPHRFSEGDPVNGHPLNGDLLATSTSTIHSIFQFFDKEAIHTSQ